MKLKKYLLSFILCFAAICMVACGKKGGETEVAKVNPTVHAYIRAEKHYIGEKLSDIGLYLESGDTSGTISWNNGDYELVEGSNDCNWTFTPTDTNTYNNKTGKMTIIAVKRPVDPIVVVEIDDEVHYEKTALSNILISLGDGSTEGTIRWKNPNTELTLGTKDYEWIFTPDDSDVYNEITRTIEIEAVAQYAVGFEITTNPRLTGYSSFETLDTTGMELTVSYNAGKVEKVSTGWTVSYQTGTALHGGDTSVTINYLTFAKNLTISEVSKISVAEPYISGEYIYTGEEQTVIIETGENSSLYEIDEINISQTDAGTYPILVTLLDSTNYAWQANSNASITLNFVIQKAELVVEEINYSGVYDLLEHHASASSNISGTIYYSLTELNSQNYQTAGFTDVIEFVNATNLVYVYYYAVGNNNYNDKTGYLTVEIEKQQSAINLEYCYTVESENYVNYPMCYITLTDGDNGTSIEIENISFTYYLSNAHTLTSLANSGAASAGGAPKNAGTYVVSVQFAGNQNYLPISSNANILIDEADNGFYAIDGNEFAFRVGDPGYYTYIEFYLEENEETNLLDIRFKSRLGALESDKKVGKLIKQSGNYLLIEDETNANYDVSFDNQEKNSLNIDGDFSLAKWFIPVYVSLERSEYDLVYQRETYIDNENPENNQISWFIITNDYGTLRYESYFYESAQIIELPPPFNTPMVILGGPIGSIGIVKETTVANYNFDGKYYVLYFYQLADNEVYAETNLIFEAAYKFNVQPTKLTVVHQTNNNVNGDYDKVLTDREVSAE